MKYDFHTHTTFSHGKGSIEDNVKAAIAAGLSSIAITDHGPGHLTYGMKRGAVPIMRAEINRLKPLYPNIEIYLGVEANIINAGNNLDVTKAEFKDYDFVLAGYHYGVIKGYCVQNFIHSHNPFHPQGWNLEKKNTDMVLKALYQNPIKILTHPGDKGPFDIWELAKACAATGTLMEISTWHAHLTTSEIKIAAKSDAQFVISSDAHTPKRVGSFKTGLQRALEAGLEVSRIVNIQTCQ